MTNIVSRLPRKGTQDTPHTLGQITKIIVHHDAQWRSADYDSVTRYIQQANYHIGKGEDGLQYHYKIDNVGEVFQCRELTDTLWHAANYPVNRASIAICLDGDFTQQKPTREQYAALKELLDNLCNQHPEFPADEDDVFGHSEVSQTGTACPGGILQFVKDYRTAKEGLAIPEVAYNDGTMGAQPVVQIPQTAPVVVPPPTTPPAEVYKGPEIKQETPNEIKEEGGKEMLKGYRTYVALGLAFLANTLPAFGLGKEFSEPLVALCLAVAAYFRSKA